MDATALQIPGALDDLYTHDGPLGATFVGGVPTLRVWAPTARSVKLKLFADSKPATTPTVIDMTAGPLGVWAIAGDASWSGKFYLYDVEVFVRSTGRVEHNLVTDPYSFSLSRNSQRSQIVDLAEGTLKPAGWDHLRKPALDAPDVEDRRECMEALLDERSDRVEIRVADLLGRNQREAAHEDGES